MRSVVFAACICRHPCRTARSRIALFPEQCGTHYEVPALGIKSTKHGFCFARGCAGVQRCCSQSFLRRIRWAPSPAFWPSKTLNPSRNHVGRAGRALESVGIGACSYLRSSIRQHLWGKDLVRAPNSASKLVLRGTMGMCLSGWRGSGGEGL